MRHPFQPILRRTRYHRQIILALLIVIGQIWPAIASAAPVTSPPIAQTDIIFEEPPLPGSEEGEGMTIILSEGAEQLNTVTGPPVADGAPLSAAETQALLDRLPPLATDPADQQDFNLPADSPPAPRTGDVITQTFPPADADSTPNVEPVEPGALQVLRYAPEGEIPIAPFLSVTFNQPMVPLATLDQLDDEDVPVKLSPALSGVWKWIGTRTLTFEYAGDVDRFPKATEYTATVPVGAESAVDGVLAAAVTWTFRTPPPVVVNSHPGYGPQPRDPLMFVTFDQLVDPKAVLATITLTADRQSYPLRLATEDEVVNDETATRLVEEAGEGRWLAFRSDEILPENTTVNVSIGPGTPSGEGPLVTEQVQSFSFQTYAALRIVETWCSYRSEECPPYSPFSIRFNNPLDAEPFSPELISVEPAIDDLIVEHFGDTIRLRGATTGRTEYNVTISADLRDIFGQTLGSEQTVTFTTTDMRSMLTGPRDPLVTLDPSAPTPTISVYSINYPKLLVRAYAVEPEQWVEYQTYQSEYRHEKKRPLPPGRLVLDETITLDEAVDQLVETPIDLSTALGGPFGHIIVTVEVPSLPIIGDLLRYDDPFVITWVQATQIGLDAFVDHSQFVAWATNLRDGAPLTDIELSLGAQTGVSDEHGVANISLSTNPAQLLVGRLGEDTAILPYNPYYYWAEEGWAQRPVEDELRWYVFDDRQMYRPGEEVHLKGWLRQIGGGPTGDVMLPNVGGSSVRYEIMGPRGNELTSGALELSELAGFDLSFTVPENSNLGFARIYFTAQGRLSAPDSSFTHSFQVQEFRRPEFEVTAQTESAGPFFLGDEAVAAVSASYFAGGPLPNAETNWDVTSNAGNYSPPNWSDFVFGVWEPWWFYQPYGRDFGANGSTRQSFAGRTDAAGKHYLKLQFTAMEEPRPYTVTADARVTDVNRQTWASSTSLLVHPSELYVGLRSERTFVEQGVPLIIEAIVTDVDGNVAPDREIELRAARLQWQFEAGEWIEKEVDPQACAVTSTDEAVSCTFDTTKGGEYRITADVRDDKDRLNRSQFTRWVSGGQQPLARNVEQETVSLIPDKERYQPGDVAEILVQAPFTPAEGLMTVARSGVLYTERFRMDTTSTTLRVPIEDAHIPNLVVQVDLTGSAPRVDDQGQPLADAPARPAYASGTLNLAIPPISRELDVTITPEASALQPGTETSIDLIVVDTDGAPVENAEVAVVVVDEAILALTGYTLADPLAVFYRERGAELSSTYGRASILLTNPQALVDQIEESAESQFGMAESAAMDAGGMALMATPAAAPMMDMAMGESVVEARMYKDGADDAPTPIEVRTDFNPLATFAPEVYTDADGNAQVDIKLPDNLTRYRIMAVAVAGGQQFGTGESHITARLPLMVRPSAPRFLNFGDRFELPVVLQNQTDEALDVAIAVRATNLDVDEEAGQSITVPANDRVEIRFPANTVNAGTARVQFAATANTPDGDFADAQEIALPVYTPATTEAFATYGVIDEGAIVQPIATPQDVFPQFGGLEISTSSTALQSLTDAVLYLTAYPFECSEQIASRVLGIAALRDVLSAFQAEGLPAPAELNATVQRDIERLQSMQNMDGGWPIWTRGRESIPFYTIHVTHALQRAEMKDYDVPEEMQLLALDHLRNIEAHYPATYSPQVRHTLSSYALYVRQLMGDVDVAKALTVYDALPLDDASLEATAWLWQVLSGEPAAATQVEEIRRHVNNSAVETPGAANFITDYGEEAYLLLHSNRRTDAIVLDALINDEPESDLIPKVVNGLLAHRTRGRWNNTQENVFVLLALDRYFNTFEAQTPDFVARMWLGDTYVAEHEFVGRSTDTQLTTVPMAYLVEPTADGGDTQDLTVQKDGVGRLYYRLGLSYAPDDLNLDQREMGFVVQREYEAVDDPDDVWRDEDGVWHVKAGARVRVRVHMVADSRRYHVALVDPLPAGLEAINPALAVSEALPDEPEISPYGRWWWGPWYQHQNLRDQRAEAFTTYLPAGVYSYEYVARATTPGEFVVPPAKAEEMYSPEVFGRSGTDRVVVE